MNSAEKNRQIRKARPIWSVSNSEIGMKKGCLRRWNLSSNNRNNLSPNRPNFKFTLGTGVHYALEQMYGFGKDPLESFLDWSAKEMKRIRDLLGPKMTGDMEAEAQEVLELGRGMVAHYAQWCKKNDVFDPVVMEHNFEVPIPGTRVVIGLLRDVEVVTEPLLWKQEVVWEDWVQELYGKDPLKDETFQNRYLKNNLVTFRLTSVGWTLIVPGLYVGTIDGIVRSKKNPNNFWLLEHKTRANLFDPEILTLDEQTSKYIWAAHQLIARGTFPGITSATRLQGVIFNVLRKKVPRKPDVLQNGAISKNKNIDTTEEVYRAAVIEAGLDPTDYADFLKILKARGNKFFQREPIRRGPQEVENVGRRLQYEFEDLQKLQDIPLDPDDPRLYPSPTEDCVWKCDFRSVCIVANYGGDTQSIIDLEYQQGRDRGASYSTPQKYGKI